jgi:hypothetical protein
MKKRTHKVCKFIKYILILLKIIIILKLYNVITIHRIINKLKIILFNLYYNTTRT